MTCTHNRMVAGCRSCAAKAAAHHKAARDVLGGRPVDRRYREVLAFYGVTHDEVREAAQQVEARAAACP